MRRRRTSPEDLAAWEQVIRKVTPLQPKIRAQKAPRRAPQAPSPPAGTGGKPAARGETAMPAEVAPAHFRIGGSALAPSIELPATPARPIPGPGLDTRTERKLRRGKQEPEAKLDLHGMTLDRAHGALTGFIRRAHAEDKRLVIVVTGKGKPRSGEDGYALPLREPGALRRQVPIWLDSPPLASMVVGVSRAGPRHGGEGALYVRLRRRR